MKIVNSRKLIDTIIDKYLIGDPETDADFGANATLVSIISLIKSLEIDLDGTFETADAPD